jgi:hypothetical protein
VALLCTVHRCFLLVALHSRTNAAPVRLAGGSIALAAVGKQNERTARSTAVETCSHGSGRRADYVFYIADLFDL